MSRNISWLKLKLPGARASISQGIHQADPYSEAGTGRAVPNSCKWGAQPLPPHVSQGSHATKGCRLWGAGEAVASPLYL